MRRALRGALALVLTLGCTHASVEVHERDVVPSTYAPRPGARLERSTGRLRRLAFVALPFERSPRDARWCGLGDACDASGFGRDVAARMRMVLTRWRGYELVELEPPAALEATALSALGAAAGVDGVLVLRGRVVYLTWLDAVSWLVTLSFAIPFSVARSGPCVEAGIYETASGRLVWQTRLSAAGSRPPVDVADALLEPLELAWPGALALPRADRDAAP